MSCFGGIRSLAGTWSGLSGSRHRLFIMIRHASTKPWVIPNTSTNQQPAIGRLMAALVGRRGRFDGEAGEGIGAGRGILGRCPIRARELPLPEPFGLRTNEIGDQRIATADARSDRASPSSMTQLIMPTMFPLTLAPRSNRRPCCAQYRCIRPRQTFPCSPRNRVRPWSVGQRRPRWAG